MVHLIRFCVVATSLLCTLRLLLCSLLGAQSVPTIKAEPCLVIPQGSFVTFVCSIAGEYESVRLEKDGRTFIDKKIDKNLFSSKKENRFFLSPVNASISGRYDCIYWNGSTWSYRSEKVELKVVNKCMLLLTWLPSFLDNTPGLKTDSIYILTVVFVVFLFCLFLLFCLHRQHQKKQRLPDSKIKQQRPQQRLSLATNGLERIPDILTDTRLPEDRRTESLTRVTGDLQEVTYAQLDHHSCTQRMGGAVAPQSTDSMVKSTLYADIIRR
ncbi:leukocyte-associated immunoglobulin-like receptor 1 [Acomys russatus]|uniref:leukocyte-associated immunoglobulin-like receptor 1 n=1 Tax=Acomys russatus TaxID=60746 RepID=UPI0021E286BE|nr:leukocyte-associated immunoglobulin-like receptor 1 [Acomys russatus]